MTDAERDVLAERRRQIEVEGWTPEHDDEHTNGAMAFAAAAYAVHAHAGPRMSKSMWLWTGWARKWFKPKDERADLVRAGALVIAEIERLDRAAAKVDGSPNLHKRQVDESAVLHIQEQRDMVLLMVRLIRRLKRVALDDPAASEAEEYLRRHRLLQPLRDSAPR